MLNKVKTNAGLILAASAVFIIIFIFFNNVHPVAPYDMDDWVSLYLYRHPFPDVNQWNPARVFPEILGPLAGSFAAFIVYPLLGDYLVSISLVIALIMAASTVVFFLVLYNLFFVFCSKKTVSLLVALLIICLYFAFFKTNPGGSQYMLYFTNLACFYYYAIPNMLNSILVCIFMYYMAQGKYIYVNSIGKRAFMALIPAVYFAVFSMLYSVLIIAAYCFFELLLNLIQKEKIIKNIPLVIILMCVIIYVLTEYNGIRFKTGAESGFFSNYSIFSVEFFRQCKTALKNLFDLGKQIHKILLFSTLGINLCALILFICNFTKDKKSPLIRAGFICLFCFIGIIPAYIMVAAKSTTGHSSSIMYMYGVFFYYILLTGLTLIYITTFIKKIIYILPFILLLLFFQTTNSNKPYLEQWDYAGSYFGKGLTIEKKKELVNNWIEEAKKADDLRISPVVIHIPQGSDSSWPLDESTQERFAEILYRHNITSRKLNIIFQPDSKITEEL